MCVDYMVANLRKLEAARFQFSIDHGFAYKSPQHYKHCVVIRWPHRKRRDKNFIDYERIDAMTDVYHAVADKYDLHDERHLLLGPDLTLIKAGIYSFYTWNTFAWAIPNSNAEVKDFVLSKLPSWAKVTEK